MFGRKKKEDIEKFVENTDRKIEEQKNAKTISDFTDEDFEKIKEENGVAEEIKKELLTDENFNMKTIIKIMKNSGMSYKQLMQHANRVAKETERIAAEKEANGEEFDRKEFLKEYMKDMLNK